MSVARASGHPDYSSAGNSKFINEIWSGKMQAKWYRDTHLSETTNNDYEGEIKDSGDKVYIRAIPTVTVNDYYKGKKLTYERPESTAIELLIDKAKDWGCIVDDIDNVQSDVNMFDMFTNDAVEQMKIAIEYAVYTTIYNQCDSSNTGTTAGAISAGFDLGAPTLPVAITKGNIIDYIVDCGTVLDEKNIPEDGRWMVIPAWMAGMLKKSDLKDASMTGDGTSPLRNGRLGMIDRFTLYRSNNLYSLTDTVTCWYVPFGHPKATTFASQIVKSETLRATDTFGDIVRGLNVYGFKVVNDDALGMLYVRR